MVLIGKNITKTYGEKLLLDHININIEDHDKIGLIGLNGSGKTSFMEILAGKAQPEIGGVELIGDKKVSYCPQEVDIDESLTIMEYIDKVISKKDYELTLIEVKSVLTKLEITDFSKPIKELSGGNKRKLALGVSIATPCDLLILDEPTNHLDSDIIEWLEKYLSKFNKALMLVTHDRYFLERVVNKIVELDRGKIYEYIANYSKYLQMKAEREEALLNKERKIQTFLRKEYEWIKRGPQARATKDKKRIENYNELINREKQVDKQMTMESSSSRLGNTTIEAYDISKSYDELLFDNFSINLSKDARIGIIGKNGAGKSTLLDILSGKTKPDSGSVVIGKTIKIGYFKQENIDLDYKKRIIEYIKDIASVVYTKNGYITATTMIENFLFDDPYIYISKLSGGEKRRLYLLSILMTSPNVLLFDEPTNDLDIETLNILEDYLESFDGIVIIVSHDRYFLDKTVNEIYSLENKRFVKYNGNYSEYLSKKKDTPIYIKEEVIREKQKKVKLTYKEEKEFSSILEEIDDIEKKITEVTELINIHYKDYDKYKDLSKEKEDLESLLMEKMERWEYLNNIYEESLKK